ncbi:hypothetical protein [Microbacterium sp. MPKO10]|nr:hypothetical protein [Microbacterium sp. MPKO10]MCW4456835.1 hypothetical protein [Microbacterium sp. MPKO10]
MIDPLIGDFVELVADREMGDGELVGVPVHAIDYLLSGCYGGL